MKWGVSLDLGRYLCVLFFVVFVFGLLVWADLGSVGSVSFPGAPGFPCGKDTFRWLWQSLDICIKHHILQLFDIGGILKLCHNAVFCFCFTVLHNSLTVGPGWPWAPFGPLSPWTPFSPCKGTQAVEADGKICFQMMTQNPKMTNLSPASQADPVYKTVILWLNILQILLIYKNSRATYRTSSYAFLPTQTLRTMFSLQQSADW